MLAGGKASKSTEPELNQLYPLGHVHDDCGHQQVGQ
jgi:hypothetical protein